MGEPVFVAEAELKWRENFKFNAKVNEFFIEMDEPTEIGGEASGLSPLDLLAASVGGCLSASLVFCLKKARIPIRGISAKSRATVTREDGYLRVKNIDVELNVEFDEETAKKAEQCFSIFRRYCIVTESVIKGIPVNLEIKTQKK
ncbi:MAG: OsmC family protein [Candidatus Freyarchaeota archaeon]|nr:OsmC family protein [Candidatus Jordarchaeia archaeon]